MTESEQKEKQNKQTKKLDKKNYYETGHIDENLF